MAQVRIKRRQQRRQRHAGLGLVSNRRRHAGLDPVSNRRRHAGLDPVSSLMLYRLWRFFVSLASCFRRNGSSALSDG